jgi:hypothetical protein
LKRSKLRFLAPLWLCFTATVSFSDELKPYEVHYKTKAKGLSMTLVRSLSETSQGDYLLSNSGRILLAGFIETSVFAANDGKLAPKHYVYKGTGLIDQRRELVFEPEGQVIKSLDDKKWKELPYSPSTYDRVSQLEQLRIHLMAGADPNLGFQVQLADRGKVKQYQLDFIGTEPLETPLGILETVHFRRSGDDPDRQSDIWLARDWDYLLVKTTHMEDATLVEALVDFASLDGQPLEFTPAAE